MAHYNYFVSPKTPLANKRINEMPDIKLTNELDNLYAISKDNLKKLFEIKADLQGTGGRTSQKLVDFSVHRQLGDSRTIKQLSQTEIETLLRNVLQLKPAYLRRIS